MPFIKIICNKNISLTALVDTGAEISLINAKIIEKEFENFKNKILKSKKINLYTANGKKLGEINKSININVQIGKETIPQSFLLIPDMLVDVILGNDFLSVNNAIINLESGKIIIGESVLNIVDGKCGTASDAKLINHLVNKNNNPYPNEGVENYEKPLKEENKNEKLICPKIHLNQIIDVLLKHKELFNYKARVTNIYEHKLCVNETLPYNTRIYPIPYKFREQVKNEISEMIKQGIIEKAETNFINPVVIVKKKDNSIRICLDARKINQITSPLYDKPVNIESIIGRLKANCLYTKLDLKNSFWLIPLHKDSRKYTGFSIEGNIYQFCVVPFGLQSSSAALIRALQVILNKYDDFCNHYVDDILIFSENEKKHYEHIKIILNELDKSGLKLNIEKCQFFQKNIEYLGYIINEKGIEINQNRLDEIKNYPRPKNLRTLRGFLGILNYYKKFIPNLSNQQIPLIELLRKGVRWKWDTTREQAFQNLKTSFHKNLTLYSPDYGKAFILRTDASDYGISGELVQIQNEIEVPICFVSRILKGYETRYSVPEKEMIALCYSVDKLKYYLTNNEFIVETDHAALQYLMNNRFTNNRIYRWSLLLQEYQFKIRHIPGVTNITADALSRINENQTVKPNTFLVAVNKFRNLEGLYSEQEVRESQNRLGNIKEKLDKQNYRGYMMKKGLIVKMFEEQEVYVIDERLSMKVINDLHERFGHCGIRKTWKIFRENFYAKNDITIAKICINNCELCLMGKYKNHVNQNTIESIIVKKPLEIIAIDFISNLVSSTNKNRHIFVILDIFTKFIKLYPCKNCNTNNVIIFINEYYKEIGRPNKILCDNATYFDNIRFRNFCNENNIKLNFTSIRHPNGNPVERYNQEVIKILRLYVHEKHNQWEEYLNKIEYYINNVPNSITHISPILIMKNILPARPWEIEHKDDIEKIHHLVKDRIYKNAYKYRQKVNQKIKKQTKFKLGELVIIKSLRTPEYKKKLCAKLKLPYEGPYKISKILGENTYELFDERRKILRGKFHINLIYPYKLTGCTKQIHAEVDKLPLKL